MASHVIKNDVPRSLANAGPDDMQLVRIQDLNSFQNELIDIRSDL